MCFQQSKSARPDYAEAYAGLAMAYLLMDQIDQARAQQKVLTELNPEWAEKLGQLIEKVAQK
jgi:hypothetical protein